MVAKNKFILIWIIVVGFASVIRCGVSFVAADGAREIGVVADWRAKKKKKKRKGKENNGRVERFRLKTISW